MFIHRSAQSWERPFPSINIFWNPLSKFCTLSLSISLYSPSKIMTGYRTGNRIGRWLFFKYFYKGPVYNRYESFPNPYASTFGRIHLSLHLLFYVISMIIACLVCSRVSSMVDLGKDQQYIYVAAIGFLTFRFVSTTWMMMSSDFMLSTGNYGVRIPFLAFSI